MSTDRELSDLEDGLRKLRLAYDKYFRGVDRIEPIKEHDDFKKRLRHQFLSPNTNTARRFRLNSIQASLVTHEQYWNRICRQIENGTFKRDKLRAEKLQTSRSTAASTADGGTEAPSAAPSQPVAAEAPGDGAPQPAAAAPGARKTHSPAIHKLHAAFERARTQSGANSAPVSIDALAATVTKQAAMIKQRYKCRSVEFRVTIKNGKPILKAIPKT